MRAGRVVAALLALGATLGRAGGAAAEEIPAGTAAPEITPPRVSYLSGEVSFWRPGAEGWAPARVNTPLAPGDRLYTGQGGTLEAQIAARAWVRAAEGTQLELESQEPDFAQFRVTAGTAALDLRELPPGHTVALSTPHAALTVERAGYYRVSVGREATAVVAYRGGRATVAPAAGNAVPIAAGQQVVVAGGDSPRVEIAAAPALSDWDRWNYARTDSLLAAASSQYVPPAVYGTEELTRYGSWRVVETYGPVWVPTMVAPGWVPYSTGRWIWDPRFGWTWLDDARWGWAPYHYGRWVYLTGVWAWAPGPIVVRPVYAPALVVFLGGPVVLRRPLGWVALGWGEPVIPWWGRPGFVGRPWWGGWGGPRLVNNVVVHRTTIVNAQTIVVYRNASVRNAVVAVPAERFGRDHVTAVRVSQPDVTGLAPVNGRLPVTPMAASLVPATGAAPRPPEAAQKPVVVVPGTQREVSALPRNAATAAAPPRTDPPTTPAAGQMPAPAPARPTAPSDAPSKPVRSLPGRVEAPERPRPPEAARVEAPPPVEKPRGERRPAQGEPIHPARGLQPARPDAVAAPVNTRSPAPPPEAVRVKPPAPEPQSPRNAAPPVPPGDGGRRASVPSATEPPVVRRTPPTAHPAPPLAQRAPATLPPPSVRAEGAGHAPRQPLGQPGNRSVQGEAETRMQKTEPQAWPGQGRADPAAPVPRGPGWGLRR